MKTLIPILIGLLVVGCGGEKKPDLESMPKIKRIALKIKCKGNLEAISAYIFEWAEDNDKSIDAKVSMNDIRKYFGDKVPECRAGGEYVLKSVKDLPTCTIGEHTLEGSGYLENGGYDQNLRFARENYESVQAKAIPSNKFIGTYESKDENGTLKFVLKPDGVVDCYANGKSLEPASWVKKDSNINFTNADGSRIFFHIKSQNTLIKKMEMTDDVYKALSGKERLVFRKK